MRCAAELISHASAFAHHSATDAAALASLLVTTQQLRNALSPRIGDTYPLRSDMLALVSGAATAWCGAVLRLERPSLDEMRRVPDVFPQLRRIVVMSWCVDPSDLGAALLARLNPFAIRDVEIGGAEVSVTDETLAGLGVICAQLETLILYDCGGVTDAGLATHLRCTSRLRELELRCSASATAAATTGGSHAGTTVTDAGLSEMLAAATQLQSLAIRRFSRVSGSFLGALPDECSRTLQTLTCICCKVFASASISAPLSKLQGLTALSINWCGRVSELPFDGLTRLPPRMESLSLTGNQLAGPVDLTQLPSTLRYCSLCSNHLTGTPNLAHLPPFLETLHLHYNGFTGDISADLARLPPTLATLLLRVSGRNFDKAVAKHLIPAHLVEHDLTAET